MMIDMPAQPEKPRSSVEMQAPKEVFQTALFSGFGGASFKETELTAQPSRETYTYEAQHEVRDSLDSEEISLDMNETDYATVATVAAPQSFCVIGCFANTYVLVEQGDDLLIIDQHAAHERLLYDKFISKQNSASQPLLTPTVLTVSHAHKLLIDEYIDVFQSLGFDIEPFGMLEYKVSAVPMVVAGVPVIELINDALSEISENRGKEVLKREMIIRASCRSAVKAGDKLSQAELLSVAQSFLHTGVTPTCPHGRPVITVITKKQIDKSFKRVL